MSVNPADLPNGSVVEVENSRKRYCAYVCEGEVFDFYEPTDNKYSGPVRCEIVRVVAKAEDPDAVLLNRMAYALYRAAGGEDEPHMSSMSDVEWHTRGARAALSVVREYESEERLVQR